MIAELDQIREWIARAADVLDEIESGDGYTGPNSQREFELQARMIDLLRAVGKR